MENVVESARSPWSEEESRAMTSGGAFRETRHSPQCVYRCMSGLVPRPDLLRSVAVGSVAHASTNSRRCRERGQPHTPPCRRRVSDTTGTPSESPVFLCHMRRHQRSTRERVESRGHHAEGMHAHDVGEREAPTAEPSRKKSGPSHCPQGNSIRRRSSSSCAVNGGCPQLCVSGANLHTGSPPDPTPPAAPVRPGSPCPSRWCRRCACWAA